MLVLWVKESRANPLKPLAWQMRNWSILPWLKRFDEIMSFSWCPSGWELMLCAGQSVPQRWRNRFAFPSARCRDLQQGWCSAGRAQLPLALPHALGLCVRGSGLEEGMLWSGWGCTEGDGSAQVSGVVGTPSKWSQLGSLLEPVSALLLL